MRGPSHEINGSLILAILLADLVLLKTAWTAYCYVVEKCFVRGPMADYCEGCVNLPELHPLNEVSERMDSLTQKLPSLDMSSTAGSTEYEPVQLGAEASAERLV